MGVFIITYDVSNDDKRDDLLASIRKLKQQVKLSESSYATDTNLSEDKLYNRFSKFIGKGDRLYIIALTQPWQGIGLQSVEDWLEEHLPDG